MSSSALKLFPAHANSLRGVRTLTFNILSSYYTSRNRTEVSLLCPPSIQITLVIRHAKGYSKVMVVRLKANKYLGGRALAYISSTHLIVNANDIW